MTSCNCDNVVKESRYTSGQCRACWLFRHVERINRVAGGDGNVYRIPQTVPLQISKTALCRVQPATHTGRPGDKLAAMLATLGIAGDLHCGCKAMVSRMNLWGLAGCRQHFDVIVAKLRKNAAKLGWLAKIKCATASARSGLAFKVNWLDPIPDLVEEAIRPAAL